MSLLKRIGIIGRRGVPYLARPLLDVVTNSQYVKADQRILIVRHRTIGTRYYAHFLDWIAREFPDLRRRIEVTTLPCRIRDWSPYRAMTTWLSEVVLVRSELIRRQVLEMEKHCQEQNIAVINPAAAVMNATKADCARIIRSAEIRTPRTETITDMEQFKKDLAGLELPLLVRTNLGHAGKLPMFKIEKPDDVNRFPLETIRSPIATEFIDTRAEDGLVRKYRYHMAGPVGMSEGLQISQHWEVRGNTQLLTEAAMAEEERYNSVPDPNHDLFQEAARALGLKMLAFDYSYDRDGRVVVWEVNTMPGLRDAICPGETELLDSADRERAAVLRLYLSDAGFEIPVELDNMLTEGVTGLETPVPASAR